MVSFITFSNHNQGVHVASEYIFGELQIVPLYNNVQSKIDFMMCMLTNGLLLDMSELCITNNEIHHHFTRQSHYLYIKMAINHVSMRSFNNTGPRAWNSQKKMVNVLIFLEKFKISYKVYFQEHLLAFNYSK